MSDWAVLLGGTMIDGTGRGRAQATVANVSSVRPFAAVME